MKQCSALFLLCALFCACSNAPDPHSLRINIIDEPTTLDPRKARDLTSGILTRMFFEGLTRINKEELPELGLASKVDISEDQKTYTFHLRNSIWSNGDPISADDFVYAWRKVLSPDFQADYAYQLYVIKNGKSVKEGKLPLDALGVTALDDKTLQVNLENPVPYFLQLTAFPAFFPVNPKVDREVPSWMYNAASFVSNGPFVLKEWKHNDHLSAKKNERYWDSDAVKLSNIQMVMVTDETALKMFEKKELDWAGSPLSSLPTSTLKDLKEKRQLLSKPLLGTYFFRMNTEKPPFNDARVRKAFALAVNRNAIVEHVLQGEQIPATGIIPSVMGLHTKPYFTDGNKAEARALVSQKGELPEVTLTYASSERNHLIGQAVQQQWFDVLGIRVRLEAVEGKVFFSRVSKQDYQLAASSWIADFNDPINFLEVFKYKKASTNNTLWEDADYIDLLNEATQTCNGELRQDLLKKSEQLIMDAMPIIPVFYYTMLYMKSDDVKDVALSSLGVMDLKWAHLDNNVK